MEKKSSYNYEELIDCANGKLFGKGNAKLPLPPMLMFDKISEISEKSGEYNNGFFKDDPVMPGCLGLDAMWQLVGFYLGWLGKPGKGRALGVNSVKFTGEVLNNAGIAKYQVDMKKILKKENATVGLANGIVFVDNKPIYEAENLKVGLFTE